MAFIVYETTFPEKRGVNKLATLTTSYMLKAMQLRETSARRVNINVLALRIFLLGGREPQVAEVTRLSI